MEKHKLEDKYHPVYTETTNNIRVSVCPQFVEEQQDPDQLAYAFSYTVTIENCGSNRVQLLNRHWFISSGGQFFSEVKGEGVVGLQPIIDAGTGFQYSSWSVIQDPIGSMNGTYEFRSDDGSLFEVEIPEFDLVKNLQIH